MPVRPLSLWGALPVSAKSPEELPHVLSQRLRFFHSRKVTTLGELRPSLHVIRPLRPLPHRPVQLLREHRHGRRNLYPLSLTKAPPVLPGLIIYPSRGVYRLGDPVQRYVGQYLVLGVDAFDVPTAVAPGAPFFYYPSRQPRRGVVKSIGQRLRFSPLYVSIRTLVPLPLLNLSEILLFCIRQRPGPGPPDKGCRRESC